MFILNEDIMNQIAMLVPYKQGLSRLRQTSRSNNQLIEITDAGKLARQANNLEKLMIACLPQNRAINSVGYGIGGGAGCGALGRLGGFIIGAMLSPKMHSVSCLLIFCTSLTAAQEAENAYNRQHYWGGGALVGSLVCGVIGLAVSTGVGFFSKSIEIEEEDSFSLNM